MQNGRRALPLGTLCACSISTVEGARGDGYKVQKRLAAPQDSGKEGPSESGEKEVGEAENRILIQSGC